MKILNKIALVLGWIDIITLLGAAIWFILASALSLLYLLLPIAIIVIIIMIIINARKAK